MTARAGSLSRSCDVRVRPRWCSSARVERVSGSADSRVLVPAGAEDERDRAGLIEFLGEEDHAEDEEPHLCVEQPTGQGACANGDNGPPDTPDDPERRRLVVSAAEGPRASRLAPRTPAQAPASARMTARA